MLVLPFSTSSIFGCFSCGCKVTLFLIHERTGDTTVKKGDSHYEPYSATYNNTKECLRGVRSSSIFFLLSPLLFSRIVDLRFLRS